MHGAAHHMHSLPQPTPLHLHLPPSPPCLCLQVLDLEVHSYEKHRQANRSSLEVVPEEGSTPDVSVTGEWPAM